MTQPTDITLANQSGANFRTELNSILQGFGSTQKGSTAPSYAVTGMHWIDDSGTPWIEKVYDGSDWISIYEINATTNTIRVINQADGTARTGGANIGQIQDSAFTWLGTSTGTNTLTASLTPAITAYAAGQVFRFIVGTTNTGAATLNINSVGAKDVQFQGAALAANSLVAGDVITVVYDGTQFQVISPVGGTEGDILYYNASNALTRLPKGTDGQSLTLASGLPSWADAGGGGGLVPIQTQTVTSAVSSVDFTTGIDGTYKKYKIEFTGVEISSTGQPIYIRTSNDGGATFDSGASDYASTSYGYTEAGTTSSGFASTANSLIRGVFTAGTTGSYSLTIYIDSPSEAGKFTNIKMESFGTNSDGEAAGDVVYAHRAAAEIVDAIRVYHPSANITKATATLYGLAGA